MNPLAIKILSEVLMQAPAITFVSFLLFSGRLRCKNLETVMLIFVGAILLSFVLMFVGINMQLNHLK